MFHIRKSALVSPIVQCLAFVAMTAGLSIAASSASAAGAQATTQIVISTGIYDLTKDAAVAALYSRIARAAHEICEGPDRPNLAQIARVKKCVNVAVENAIENADIAPLTAYYASKKRSSNASTTPLTASNVSSLNLRD